MKICKLCGQQLCNGTSDGVSNEFTINGSRVVVCRRCAFKHYDAPIAGRQYALTGKPSDKCILNGNTWSESKIN